MFSQRLRGLINLHAAVSTFSAVVLLAAFASAMPHLPMAPLSPDLNLTPYYLCVGFALIVSTKFVQQLAPRFHRVTWADAAWLATRQVGLVLVFVFGMMFAFKDRNLSRVFMGSYLVLCWFVLVLINQGLPGMISRLFFEHARRVPTIFVGTSASMARLRGWLTAKEVLGLHPTGFISLENIQSPNTVPPFLGLLPELGQRIDETGAAQVIVLEIPRTEKEGRYIIDACQTHGARLLIYSNLAEQLRHPLVTVTEEGHQFYTLQEEPLEDPFNRLLKRAFDLTVSIPIVVFVLPPLTIVTWLVQRFQAPGPVFFSQERTGYGHRVFRIFKYRSMYLARPGNDEAIQATKGDARIFPFGRFLRRSSLDEFPQFWNVLIGEMSVIGPRPHLIKHDQLFAQQMNAYRTRFFAKPGITGLAQCNGLRGEITDATLLQKRIELDLRYIATWSIWIDLQITAKTAKQMLAPPKTAY